MEKLKEINGYVRATIDKLPSIRTDLGSCKTRQQLARMEVCLGTTVVDRQNPISHGKKPSDISKYEKLLNTKQSGNKNKKCVYCNK